MFSLIIVLFFRAKMKQCAPWPGRVSTLVATFNPTVIPSLTMRVRAV